MTNEHDQGVAADLATDLGEELIPRVRDALACAPDSAVFWSCLLHFLIGAMRGDLGHDLAERVVAGLSGWVDDDLEPRR